MVRDDADKPRRPLYARLLRLRHIEPGPVLCFLYFEGSIAVSVLFALLGVVQWWAVLVVPVTVAAMVKLNDVVAGRIARAGARPRPRPGGRTGGGTSRGGAGRAASAGSTTRGSTTRGGTTRGGTTRGSTTRAPGGRTGAQPPPSDRLRTPPADPGQPAGRPAGQPAEAAEPASEPAEPAEPTKEPLPPRPAEFLTPPSRNELRDSETRKVTPPSDVNGDGEADADGRPGRSRGRSSRLSGPPTRRTDETGSRRRRSR